MSKIFLALVAMLAIGMGVANAAAKLPPHQQQGDNFNFLEGGGG